jgi:thiamine-monophosphate kinase
MQTNKKKIPIADLGEFALIEHLMSDIQTRQSSTLMGVGDDAAVMQYGDTCQLLSTCILLEGVHFNLMYTPLKHLGYEAVVAGISNIYAMNAYPRQLALSLGVSAKFYVEDLEELYEGVRLACEQYNVDFVSGDTSASLTGLVLNITVIGEAEKDKITYRSGAHANDLLCLSGNLGAAYMGLQLLERERIVFESTPNFQPQLGGYDYILQRQLKPEARKDIIDLLREIGIKPTAMIDISDGLASELLHIGKQSGVGVRVYLDKLPIAAETFKICDEMNIDAVTAALNGGGDYELLFTIPLEQHEKIKGLDGFNIIGHITDAGKGNYLVTPDGEEIALKAQGWK